MAVTGPAVQIQPVDSTSINVPIQPRNESLRTDRIYKDDTLVRSVDGANYRVLDLGLEQRTEPVNTAAVGDDPQVEYQHIATGRIAILVVRVDPETGETMARPQTLWAVDSDDIEQVQPLSGYDIWPTSPARTVA